MKIFVLLALAFSGLADSTIYQTDPYHNVPVYMKAENDYQGRHHYSEPYNNHRTYNYNYNVKDAYSSIDYGQQETSNGKGSVSGTYHVMLPDGRKQTVIYQADENGYVADIQYEGEAHSDETLYSTDTYPTLYTSEEGKHYETPQHNKYHVNHYTPTTTEKYSDTYSTSLIKDQKIYHQTHYVKANIPYAKYPDIYPTLYHTGHENHHTHYPKDNTHSGTPYIDQYHNQDPYVKEHVATSTKYNPNPHPKYPHPYSIPYPKGNENYQTPYGQSNHPVSYTKDSHHYGTPNTTNYSDNYSTTYSNVSEKAWNKCNNWSNPGKLGNTDA